MNSAVQNSQAEDRNQTVSKPQDQTNYAAAGLDQFSLSTSPNALPRPELHDIVAGNYPENQEMRRLM